MRRSEGVQGGEGRVRACLASPVLHVQKLVWPENDRAELGEELLNPQVESLFLDPEIKVVVDQNSGDSNESLLALDHLFISFPVEEANGLL